MCLIPTLADDPLTQPWEILSEATPSRAPKIAVKPKLLPWYEMMTTSRPNSDGGGGVKACEVTNTLFIFFPSYFSSFIFNFSFRLSRISPTVRTMFRHIKIYVKYASLSTVFPKALHIIARAPVFSVSPSTSVGSCIIDDSRAVEL